MTPNFENAFIQSIVIHKVGNSATEGHLFLSNNYITLRDPDSEELIMKFFTKPFGKNPINYHFKNIEHNDLYSHTKRLLESNDDFVRGSQNIAKNLFESCDHPAIPLGDFIIIKFTDVLYEEQMVNAIGLFKCDNKDTFLKIYGVEDGEADINFDSGINLNKLDKSALILDMCEDDGYVVFSSDSKSTTEGALYWNRSFLNLEPYKDDYFNTLNTIQVCSQFIQSEAERHPEEARALQAKMLSKSEEYFHNRDTFKHQEFGDMVFEENSPTKNAFYAYLEEHNNELVDENAVNNIAPEALKKGQKFFKSVLKLDRYFHVYVHGGGHRLEKGFDKEKNLKFYKLFYEMEE